MDVDSDTEELKFGAIKTHNNATKPETETVTETVTATERGRERAREEECEDVAAMMMEEASPALQHSAPPAPGMQEEVPDHQSSLAVLNPLSSPSESGRSR